MRGSLLALMAVLAAALSAPAQAAPAVVTKPVTIAATQPDDSGNPVALDGGVTLPIDTSSCPCPGVIINHGFLGKWTDSREVAEKLAEQGYVVLRYSSRGFGKTPGEVDLMGPKETQDLLDAVHWLNAPGNPVVGGLVRHNRIGQFGGSYGGAHAWALAMSRDPAVRTVVPTATWSDIFDALLPKGVMLLAYANGFYATGFAPTGSLVNNQEPSTQLNYSANLHRWMAEANSGVNVADMKAGLRDRSVAYHYNRVKIPVFIVQGTNDGLFSANQAIDAYTALRKRHVKARLYLGGIGHPPSESSLNSPEAQHLSSEVLAWFDHYLKGEDNAIDREPPIEFSRADYFHNHWDGTTQSAKRFPVGPRLKLHLCTSGPSGGALSTSECADALPAAVVNGSPASGYDQEPVTAEYAEQFDDGVAQITGSRPDTTTLPPVLTYDSPPLKAATQIVGAPLVSLQVAATDFLPAGMEGAVAAFQLDPKLYDVDDAGHAKLLTRGAFSEPLDAVAPGPSSVAQHAVRFEANGMSNRVPAGHTLRLTLQTTDLPYLRPTPNPFTAVVFGGSSLTLPTFAG